MYFGTLILRKRGKMFKKKQKPVIEFISKIPFLKDVEGVSPVPANKFIPDWWFDTPYSINQHEKYFSDSRTVRQCPAFPDLFHTGYILPMWADTTLYFNSNTKQWRWRCGNSPSPFKINFFEPHQFTNTASYDLKSMNATAIFQFENPWTIRASEGYSLFQFPLFYHNNKDFSVLPGIYDSYSAETDKLEIAYFEDDKEILIKRGTPLVHYIPYKKEKVELIVRDETEEDKKIYQKKQIERATMFKSWYSKNKNRGN